MLPRAHARRRLARLGLPAVLAACAAAALPASAAAAARFASPASTTASGDCAQPTPCTLAWAVSGAVAGDDVTLAPGTYQLASRVRAKVPITLHGVAGQPTPQLVAGPSVSGPYAVALTAGGSISHVTISASGDHQAALKLKGASGDDLLLSAGGSGDSGDGAHAAAVLVTVAAPAPPTALRDTVAWAHGPALAAVVVKTTAQDTDDVGGDARSSSSSSPSLSSSLPSRPSSIVPPPSPSSGAVLVNVTAIASGEGSIGVKATASAGAVSLTDVIARGAGKDVAAPAGNVAASFSDFRPAASSGVADQGHDTAADPAFADASAGDFHELGTSPTVDAGTLTAQSGTADPDGNPRQIGSAPDIGAYEFNPAAPALTGGLGPVFPGDSGALPPPVAEHSFNVEPDQGQVLVRPPGATTFTALTAGQQLPVGSTVDVSAGVVKLTSARDTLGTTQTGRFWGGRVRVDQGGGASPITELSLTGALPGCRRAGGAGASPGQHIGIAAAARRPRTRRLWGSDSHGHFSTRGNDALATVRGTVWMMEDRCGGTLTKVVKGRVSVRDLHTGRSFMVRAGHQRLVRAHH